MIRIVKRGAISVLFQLIKHKKIWIAAIILIFYGVIIPCQHNILNFYNDIWLAEKEFWLIAGMIIPVFSILFLFLIFNQLYQPDIVETVLATKSVNLPLLVWSWVFAEILYLPGYIWYLTVYPNAMFHIGVIILFTILLFLLFYVFMRLFNRVLSIFFALVAVILLINIYCSGQTKM